jgi:hypothetical protein
MWVYIVDEKHYNLKELKFILCVWMRREKSKGTITGDVTRNLFVNVEKLI